MKVVVQFNRLPSLGSRAVGEVAAVIQDGALEIQGAAQSIAPVDTGRLRSSITTQREVGVYGVTTYEVVTDVEYARYVEQGTRFQAAQPYLRPAFERHRLAIIAALVKELAKLR